MTCPKVPARRDVEPVQSDASFCQFRGNIHGRLLVHRVGPHRARSVRLAPSNWPSSA
jgi:hypothetical protein